jgi:hypothetical protein
VQPPARSSQSPSVLADPIRWLPYRVPSRLVIAFVAFAIALGALLRFGWLTDMEYKFDEEWMFERSQAVPAREPWPTLGMTSSVGLKNPGLSAVVFVVLAKLSGAHDPVALCRAVVACNVLAFLVLFVWVVRALPKYQQEPWLWALALAAVNPLAVLMHRKIWAQSILPIFCALFLIGWLRRARAWGALLWGVIGAVIGQVHMSGFFFAAGFAAWELTVGKARNGPRTKWSAWLVGSFAGACTLIPWIQYVLRRDDPHPPYDLQKVLTFEFYPLWLSEMFGFGLEYSLGAHYQAFLREPHYLPMCLNAGSIAVGAYAGFHVLRALWRRRAGVLHAASGALSRSSEAAYTCCAAFVGYGLCITLSGITVWRAYLLITFPLPWMALAYLMLRFVPQSRRALCVLWLVQLGLSLAFLLYIHEHNGAPGADYGRGFRWQ